MPSGGGESGRVISLIQFQFPGNGPSLKNRSFVRHIQYYQKDSFIWNRFVVVILLTKNTDDNYLNRKK